jgi:hypothetical protein
MTVYLASFSTPNFSKSHAILDKSARKNGINDIFHYTFETDIKGTAFHEKNQAIFDFKKGIGFWLWKPYLILESLKKMPENGILVYADSGLEIMKPLDDVLEICEKQEDIVFFQAHGYKNKVATHRDTFVLMDCDTPPYHDAEMVQASFILFKKTKKTIQFVEEWLSYCENINIISDLPNISGKDNFEGFIHHVGDQSVVSILRIKHKIPVFRNPSQQGNPHISAFPNSNYPQLIFHHWGRPDGRFAGPLRRILLKFGIWRI